MYKRLSILNNPNANPALKPYFAPMSDDIYIYIARNFFQQLNISAITEDNFHHILDALSAYRAIYYHLGVYELVDSMNFILDELCEYLPVDSKFRYRHRKHTYRPPYEEIYFSKAQDYKFIENINKEASEEYKKAIHGKYFKIPTMWRENTEAYLPNDSKPTKNKKKSSVHSMIEEIPNEYPEEEIDKDKYDKLLLDTVRNIEEDKRRRRHTAYYEEIAEWSKRAINKDNEQEPVVVDLSHMDEETRNYLIEVGLITPVDSNEQDKAPKTQDYEHVKSKDVLGLLDKIKNKQKG